MYGERDSLNLKLGTATLVLLRMWCPPGVTG
jgi:hypothetical protein